MQSMWKEGHRQMEPLAFGLNGTNVMDMKESKTLVFLLHHIDHFSLLVGYPDAAVWEFYNSSTSDHYSLSTCKESVGWLTQKFAVYGWNDPSSGPSKKRWTSPTKTMGTTVGSLHVLSPNTAFSENHSSSHKLTFHFIEAK